MRKRAGRMAEALFKSIQEDLCIPASQQRAFGFNKVACLVHESWLSTLLVDNLLLKDAHTHQSLDPDVCELALYPSQSQVPFNWHRVRVKVIHKVKAKVNSLLRSSLLLLDDADNIPQILNKLTQANLKNIWQEAFSKYGSNLPSFGNSSEEEVFVQDYEDMTRDLLSKVFNCDVIDMRGSESQTMPAGDKIDCSCILQPYAVIETSRSFYIVHPYLQYTLHDLVTYSPANLDSSYVRPLFVVYQLLRVAVACHGAGVVLGNLTLKDIMLDDKLWVHVLPVTNSVLKEAILPEKRVSSLKKSDDVLNSDILLKKNLQNGAYTLENLPELTYKWMEGKISNYVYLMLLNQLAGRRMGDPDNHPVLPWVMDFSKPNGGYRDLGISKYRLNKGDEQLDLTFKGAQMIAMEPSTGSEPLQVPHHVSDILSDITYYVYTARRTPKDVLCLHVRTKWVPNEYPSSMRRMQAWTPDECIPEFFTDPTIFSSIHKDLGDLEIPKWCSSPEEFVAKHMAVLESDVVSQGLHKWIDLTFGYKLSGSASVKAKNVCLQLVDNHTGPINHGVVQLFEQLHPRKLGVTAYSSDVAPNILRCAQQPQEVINDSVVERDRYSALSLSDLRSNSQSGAGPLSLNKEPYKGTIVLPNDYNPLEPLEQIEAQHSFSTRVFHSNPVDREEKANIPNRKQDLKARDMQAFGCIIVEMFLSSHLRMTNPGASLRNRVDVVRRVAENNFHDIPSPVTQVVSHLLCIPNQQITLHRPGDSLRLSAFDYPNVMPNGDPPPTPCQLIHDANHLLRFPAYFPQVYRFLCKIRTINSEIKLRELTLQGNLEMDEKLARIYKRKINVVSRSLESVLAIIDQHGMGIILPYLVELFSDPHTAVQSVWSLFDLISKSIGPAQMLKHFLHSLIALYDGGNVTTKHIKIYHRTFLLKLLVHLGLSAFLNNILTLLIEAVSGYKNFKEDEHVEECAGQEFPTGASLDEDIHDEISGADFSEDYDTQSRDDVTGDESESTSGGMPDRSSIRSGSSFSSERAIYFRASNMTDPDADSIGSIGADEYNAPSDTTYSKSATSNGSVFSAMIEEAKSNNAHQDGVAASHLEGSSHVVLNNGVSYTKTKRHSMSAITTVKTDDNRDNTTSTTPTSPDRHIGLPNSYTNDTLASTDTLVDRMTSKEYNISDVAADSVKWLAVKLGPVLTAKHLTRNLLRMLSLCYLGEEQVVVWDCNPSSPDAKLLAWKKTVTGDKNASKILSCLSSIAALYGEQIILLQYFKHMTEAVSQAKRRLTIRAEANLIGCLALLFDIMPYLSDATVIDNLQDVLISPILSPIMDLVTSCDVSFPGSHHTRSVVTFKLLNAMYKLALRIERDKSKEHLTVLLQQLFDNFDVVHGVVDVKKNALRKRGRTIAVPPIREGLSGSNEFLNIKKDSLTDEYHIGTPVSLYSPSRSMTESGSWQRRSHSLTPMANVENDEFDEEASANHEKIMEELKMVFTSELAHTTYVPFCKIVGDIHMEQHIKNDDLIRNLCNRHDEALSKQLTSNAPRTYKYSGLDDSDSSSDSSDDGSLLDTLTRTDVDNTMVGVIRTIKSGNTKWYLPAPSVEDSKPNRSTDTECHGSFGQVTLLGNKLVALEEAKQQEATVNTVQRRSLQIKPKSTDFSVEPEKLKNPEMIKSNKRHLKGNWLAYWEHELGLSERHETSFNFKQITLQTFQGHVGGVRCIYVLDNENSIISASKDKTVKLWSLKSQGDGSATTNCQWTYTGHKKSVFSVAFLEPVRLAASCDSTVHLWDPFVGKHVKQFDSVKSSPVTHLCPLPAPSQLLVTATNDATLRFLDTRSKEYLHEFRCAIGPAGLIRGIAVSPNGQWVAVGYSTGLVSLLDVRTGWLQGTWKGHNDEILQIRAFDNNKFVTSSFDQNMTLWNTDTQKPISSWRSPGEPVHCFNFYKKEIVSITTGNRVGVHACIEGQSSNSSTKLRSDTFKGVLTTMTVLPLNRQLLLGADNGTIKLLC